MGELIYHGPLANVNDTLDPNILKAAIWRMRTSNAPDIDGITAGMLRKAWPALGESTTGLFDRCMKEGTFPNCWKVARLVIINKTGGNRSQPG